MYMVLGYNVLSNRIEQRTPINTITTYHGRCTKSALDLNAQMFDAVRETWVDRWTWLDY